MTGVFTRDSENKNNNKTHVPGSTQETHSLLNTTLPSLITEIAGCLGFLIVTNSPEGGWICRPRLILRDLGCTAGLAGEGCRGFIGGSGVMCSSEDEEL